MLFKFTALSALLFSAVLAAPQNPKLRLSRTGKAEKDSYIVVLKDNASRDASLQALNDLVVAFDDIKEVTNSDWEVLNGYSAKLTGAALTHVLADPLVDYVEEDAIISLDWVQEGSGPVERGFEEASIQARTPFGVDEDSELFELLTKRQGAGVDVYGVDTGVRITHSTFGGRARWGAVFIGSQSDGNGHGTHTASLAAGSGFSAASAASVIAVKVLGDDGSGTTAGVVSGVNYVTTTARSSGRPSVANLSLGGGAATSLDTAVSNAIAAGVHFTIAAGNSNVNAANTSPARVAAAITVGAISSARAKASFSNFGAVLDVWFLGVSVTAAWSTSDSATNTISGTSMAAPGVAGLVAANVARVGNRTPAVVRNALVAAGVADVTGAPSGTTNIRAVAF